MSSTPAEPTTEEMIRALYRLFFTDHEAPSDEDFRRAIIALNRGDKAPLDAYLKKGGRIPAGKDHA